MKKKNWVSVLYIIIGAITICFSFAGMVDEFWSGMGSSLFIIGVIQLLRFYRFQKNEAYREKIEIEQMDERNHFIRNKAWAWAGYLYVMLMAVASIVLKIVGQDVLSIAASGSVGLVIILFWVSYYILKRKY